MSEAILSVEGLSVAYPGARRGLRRMPVRAVREVSFDVAEGETFGLVGESGSGKSTIGRAVLGLVRPTAGRVLLAGRQVAGASRAEALGLRKAAQVVFQDPAASLNPARTIVASLGEPLRLHRGMRGDAATAEAGSLCRQVSLSDELIRRLPAELSGGQRQRAAIARALAPHPRLIVCDEPITALDVSTQAQVVNLFVDLQDDTGVALLFISHDLSVVRHIAQRVGVMFAGHLVEAGDTATVCGSPSHPYTRALLASVPVADPVRQRERRLARQQEMRGAVSEPGSDSVGCPYVARCPRADGICRAVAPSLDPLPDGRLVACHHPGAADTAGH